MDLNNKDQIIDLLNAQQKIILDFYADWCPPCKKMLPIFSEVAEILEFQDLHFLKVNVDVFPNLSGDYKITSIPTIVLIKGNGTDLHKITGTMDKDDLIDEINKFFF